MSLGGRYTWSKYDYYWPSFSHLGEQAVLQQEIYATNDAKENDKVFGYQERYAEYRYKPSTIVGKLRSNAGGSWLTSTISTSGRRGKCTNKLKPTGKKNERKIKINKWWKMNQN
jgi:hypothetical protein